MKPIILVVDDDNDLREIIKDLLSDYNYLVYTASTGTSALKLVEKIKPNLVLLDLGLPDISGESVCDQIKASYPNLPVLILTASDKSQDVIESFERGADDYINKPFVNTELLARIRARLREHKLNDPLMKIEDLELNTETYEARRKGKTIELTSTEYELLHYLMLNPDRVLSREQILSHVWSQNPDIETRVVDVYIGYLRKKIDEGQKKKLIQSKRGFGYYLKTN